MPRTTVTTRVLATAAITGIGSWIAIVALLHLIQFGRYSPIEQAMSELALGRHGYLMNVAFTLLGMGLVALALSYARAVDGGRAVPALLAVGGVLGVLSGVFQPSASGAPATTESVLHEVVGVTLFVAVTVAMFASVRRFRRDRRWKALARPTLLWGVLTAASFFLIPILEQRAFGVAQRILVGAWMSWTLLIAIHARRLSSARPTAKAGAPTGAVAARPGS